VLVLVQSSVTEMQVFIPRIASALCGVLAFFFTMFYFSSGIFFSWSLSNAQFLQTAALVTRDTLAAHGLQADVVVTDLVHGLEKRLAGSVDVLLFNPPYVPTPEYEVHIATPNLDVFFTRSLVNLGPWVLLTAPANMRMHIIGLPWMHI
jgi:hypothetical protein